MDNAFINDLRCLFDSLQRPFSLKDIQLSLPWFDKHQNHLDQLILMNVIQKKTIYKSPPNTADTQDTCFKIPYDFFFPWTAWPSPVPTLSINDTMEESEDTIHQIENVKALNQMNMVVKEHGIDFFPSDVFPLNSTENVKDEFLSLKKLRNQHVANLWELNEVLAKMPKHQIPVKPAEAVSTIIPTSQAELARLDDHKRAKLNLKKELVDLTNVLIGLLADRTNRSASEVIEELKPLA